MTPLKDRVIVKTEAQDEYTTDSGLYVADHDAQQVIGTVLSVGMVSDIKPDDVVIFSPFAGQRMDHEGGRYLVLREDDILAVVE